MVALVASVFVKQYFNKAENYILNTDDAERIGGSVTQRKRKKPFEVETLRF